LKLRVLLLAGSVLLLVLASLLLPSSAVAEHTKRLAVLELSGTLNREVLSVLSDQLRQGALTALKGTAYQVMTRENMATLARANGLDLAACQDGAECEVDIGRNIGADIIISGAVTRIGSSMVVTLKLHSTTSGTLLESRTVRSADEEGLRIGPIRGVSGPLLIVGMAIVLSGRVLRRLDRDNREA
jgi:TolB-like protein